MAYRVGVKVFGEAPYHHNGLIFGTHEEAEIYGRDLATRWTLVENWRVEETYGEVNYRIEDGQLAAIK